MSCDKVRYRSNGFLEQVYVCSTDAAVRARRVGTAFRTLSLRTFDRLDCAANAKINLRHSLYIAWSSCSDLTNTVHSRIEPGEKAWLSAIRSCDAINVAPVPRHLVFKTMGRRHRKFKQAVFLLHVRSTVRCT